MSTRVHELKSWPFLFSALVDGSKTHEMRRADRDFKVGDTLRLREYDPEKEEYTGRAFQMIITYITSAGNPCALSESGLNAKYCILSVKSLKKGVD